MAKRVLHTDDRTFSNFQAPELVKLCGVPQGRWPVYVVKELLDNAAAALEEFSVSNPTIKITIDSDFVVIKDNGPGIPDHVLDVVLDFTAFGGSNRHHKLPTRGAQGNAVMTIIGIASVWGLGIEFGRKAENTLRLDVDIDQVRQRVDPVREIVTNKPEGSYIKVELPELPWKRGGSKYADIVEIVRQFAWINPHITFMVVESWGPKRTVWSVPRISGAKPAMTGAPDCGAASWFTVDEFGDRLAADVRARPDMTIAQWMREFMKADVKMAPSGSIGARVPDDKNALLLLAEAWRRSTIRAGSQVDKPGFNPMGRERMAATLTMMGADEKSPSEYASASGVFDRKGAKVPYLVEVCLVQMPEGSHRAPDPMLAMNRTVLYGSPSFSNLKWREKVRGHWHEQVRGDLSTLARSYSIDRGKYSAAWMIHITCPSPGYTGYGKQSFETDWLGPTLGECVERVTLQVRKQKHGEAKRKKQGRKHDKTIRQKMFENLGATLKRDTENGALPILLRQLYYGFRKDWYTLDDRELHYPTFCAYVDEYERDIAGREICLKDPRGTMFEPHSGRVVQLGTSQVRDFKPKKWEGHTIIFLEKENLAHLLRNLKIGKRWDAIIVGAKGFAVHAIRDVLQKYKQLLGTQVKIICLHDADPAGYLIGHDLRTNLPRFGHNVDLKLIDVGLTMAEARAMDLQDEPFPVVKVRGGTPALQEWSKIYNMRRIVVKDHDGTRRPLLEPEAWDAFMPREVRGSEKPRWVTSTVLGRRVELNAMPPRVFGKWVESKLEEHGCAKVRPPDEIVDKALRHSRETQVNREMGELFMRMMGDDVRLEVMRELGVPSYDLDSVLAGRPEQHWSYLVNRAGQGDEAKVRAAVEAVLRRRAPGMFS